MPAIRHAPRRRKEVKDIVKMFRRFNRLHFRSVIPLPRIVLSTRLKRAGQVTYSRWLMEISVPYHNRYGWGRELERTVKHEMIHLYLRRKGLDPGHTAEFREWCRHIGAFFHCKDFSGPDRYVYRCPRGHRIRTKRRLARPMSCARCDAERYNPNHRFVLERELRAPKRLAA
jgi:predicted SprT family Zn-dependent metalloprotease